MFQLLSLSVLLAFFPLFASVSKHVGKSYQYDVLHEGRFLRLATIDGWELVERTSAKGNAVAIAAINGKGQLILVEQFRKPIQARELSLPAGLIADKIANETVLQAAKKELEEESAYTAELNDLKEVTVTPSSPGLTNELVHLVVAKKPVQKIKSQKLEEAEKKAKLNVVYVKLENIRQFIEEKKSEGVMISPSLYTALFYLQK